MSKFTQTFNTNATDSPANIILKESIELLYNNHIGEDGRKWEIYKKLLAISPERVKNKTEEIDILINKMVLLFKEGANRNLQYKFSESKIITPSYIAILIKNGTLANALLQSDSSIIDEIKLTSEEKKELRSLKKSKLNSDLIGTTKLLLHEVKILKNPQEISIIDSNKHIQNVAKMKNVISDLIDNGANFTGIELVEKNYFTLIYLINELQDVNFKQKLEPLIPTSYKNAYYRSNPQNISKRLSNIAPKTYDSYQETIDNLRIAYEVSPESFIEKVKSSNIYKTNNINYDDEIASISDCTTNATDEDLENGDDIDLPNIVALSPSAPIFFTYEQKKRANCRFFIRKKNYKIYRRFTAIYLFKLSKNIRK